MWPLGGSKALSRCKKRYPLPRECHNTTTSTILWNSRRKISKEFHLLRQGRNKRLGFRDRLLPLCRGIKTSGDAKSRMRGITQVWVLDRPLESISGYHLFWRNRSRLTLRIIKGSIVRQVKGTFWSQTISHWVFCAKTSTSQLSRKDSKIIHPKLKPTLTQAFQEAQRIDTSQPCLQGWAPRHSSLLGTQWRDPRFSSFCKSLMFSKSPHSNLRLMTSRSFSTLTPKWSTLTGANSYHRSIKIWFEGSSESWALKTSRTNFNARSDFQNCHF